MAKPAWIKACSLIHGKTFAESLRVFQPNVTFEKAFNTVPASSGCMPPRFRMPTPAINLETLSANTVFLKINMLFSITN